MNLCKPHAARGCLPWVGLLAAADLCHAGSSKVPLGRLGAAGLEYVAPESHLASVVLAILMMFSILGAHL